MKESSGAPSYLPRNTKVDARWRGIYFDTTVNFCAFVVVYPSLHNVLKNELAFHQVNKAIGLSLANPGSFSFLRSSRRFLSEGK
jgi:hypothetical protein